MTREEDKILDEIETHLGGYDVYKGAIPKQEIQLSCATCRARTAHEAIVSVVRHDWTDDKQFTDIYQVVKCGGCRRVSFINTSWRGHEEEINPESNEWEAVIQDHQYPGTTATRHIMSGRQFLPTRVRDAYDEATFALNHEQHLSAGFGLRAVVEAACVDKSIRGGKMEEKIDRLVAAGLVTKAGAARLHLVRKLGNAVVHEMEAYPTPTLLKMLREVNHLLTELYVQPAEAKGLFDASG